jgi:hypothetical protein
MAFAHIDGHNLFIKCPRRTPRWPFAELVYAPANAGLVCPRRPLDVSGAFYELGIRHSAEMPAIHIVKAGTVIAEVSGAWIGSKAVWDG